MTACATADAAATLSLAAHDWRVTDDDWRNDDDVVVAVCVCVVVVVAGGVSGRRCRLMLLLVMKVLGTQVVHWLCLCDAKGEGKKGEKKDETHITICSLFIPCFT